MNLWQKEICSDTNKTPFKYQNANTFLSQQSSKDNFQSNLFQKNK